MAYAGLDSTHTRVRNALQYLNSYWNSTSWDYGNFGDFYSMYGVTKGCLISVPGRIDYIGSHNWQDEYNMWLVNNQLSSGTWSTSRSPRMDNNFVAALGVAILIRTISGCWPIAEINAPATVPPDNSFEMDGANSYHICPNDYDIVEWAWDFNLEDSDTIDWDNPDAYGIYVNNPGYTLPPGVTEDPFVVSLRARDNTGQVDIDQHTVIVDIGNHYPVAKSGGPYAAKPYETVIFDGTGSYDPDTATLGDYIASYAWDLDGDGQYDDCYDSICEETYTQEASWTIGLKVVDSYGWESTSPDVVTIWISKRDVYITDADLSFSSWNLTFWPALS
jgi:hypothetical protein